jgi:hypothetical protein
MDPELKQELAQIRALVKDNHDMLRAIRRDQWLGFVGRVIVWIVVLGLPLYLYHQYMQPFVSAYTHQAGLSTSGPFGLPTFAEIEKLINSFKAGH